MRKYIIIVCLLQWILITYTVCIYSRNISLYNVNCYTVVGVSIRLLSTQLGIGMMTSLDDIKTHYYLLLTNGKLYVSKEVA